MDEFRQYSTDGGQTWHPPLPQRPEPEQPNSGERLPVSDEARTAALRAMDIHPAEASRALGDALEAAAPHIARAAQVRILREMAERYSRAAGLENAAEDYDDRCHDRLLWMATQLGIEADALESP
jgi:hypothetical protein